MPDKKDVFTKLQVGGLDAYLVDLPRRTDEMTISVCVRAGFFFAKNSQYQVPHLLEHLIALNFRPNDWDYDAWINNYYVVYELKSTRKKLHGDLKKLYRLIFEPDFSDTEVFEFEKKILVNELATEQDEISERIYREMTNSLLDDFGLADHCSISDIKKFTIKEVEDFHRHYYNLENTKLFISGYKISNEQISEIEEIILAFPLSHKETRPFPILKHAPALGEQNIDIESNQSYLSFFWISVGDPPAIEDRVALNVIYDLLVKDYSSRLFIELRKKRGLVYGVEATTHFGCSFNSFRIYCATQRENVEEAKKVIMSEIQRIKEGKIDAVQMKKNLKKDNKDIKENWKNNEKRFQWVVSDILDFGAPYDLDDLIAINKKINKAKIREVATKYLRNDNLSVFASGIKSKI